MQSTVGRHHTTRSTPSLPAPPQPPLSSSSPGCPDDRPGQRSSSSPPPSDTDEPDDEVLAPLPQPESPNTIGRRYRNRYPGTPRRSQLLQQQPPPQATTLQSQTHLPAARRGHRVRVVRLEPVNVSAVDIRNMFRLINAG